MLVQHDLVKPRGSIKPFGLGGRDSMRTRHECGDDGALEPEFRGTEPALAAEKRPVRGAVAPPPPPRMPYTESRERACERSLTQ